MAKGGGKGERERELVPAQFMLERRQVIALQRAALDKKAGGATGRASASAVLRDVLDAWLKGRARG